MSHPVPGHTYGENEYKDADSPHKDSIHSREVFKSKAERKYKKLKSKVGTYIGASMKLNNIGIGFLKDNTQILKNAIGYLEKYGL